VLALGACSSSKSSGPSDPPSSPGSSGSGATSPGSSAGLPSDPVQVSAQLPDVCARVPAADVARVAHLSGTVKGAAKSETRLDAGCEYTASGGSAVKVNYLPEERSAFDSSRKTFEGGEECANVPGVGDAAYRCTDPLGALDLYAFARDHTVRITMDNHADDDVSAATALATFALTRL
jgi:hypothetical protein